MSSIETAPQSRTAAAAEQEEDDDNDAIIGSNEVSNRYPCLLESQPAPILESFPGFCPRRSYRFLSPPRRPSVSRPPNGPAGVVPTTFPKLGRDSDGENESVGKSNGKNSLNGQSMRSGQ